eukprot:TRINITY_DN12628_c0_g2_i1.p1 TRINITY_DN12628_c0_g2~~TRINITY_DN12628_c0_g2_i1.p1  ORF type:complete len:484 (-),score=112.93 TRINITY_DN12628_c0_g2_i1:125-1519(-)
MASEFLQRLVGSREGCFFNAAASLDVSVTCHCFHSVEVAQGEQLVVSVRDALRRDAEQLAPVGAYCTLKGLELDSTLLLRVWASREDLEHTSASTDSKGLRQCGEVRIPLSRVASHCGGMLYRTWLTLDSPGLRDSVASIGLLAGGDDNAEFDQRLVDGPRQLFQPKLCLSVCRTSDLSPSGKLVLAPSAANEVRVAAWPPLLRSQQQHAVLSAALHLQRSNLGGQHAKEQQAKLEQSLQQLSERLQAQAAAIDELKTSLHRESPAAAAALLSQSCGGGEVEGLDLRPAADGSISVEVLQKLLSRQGRELRNLRAGLVARQGAAGAEAALKSPQQRDGSPGMEESVAQARLSNAKREVQIQSLRGELDKLREEAYRKAEAADDRIRALERDRDEASKEAARLRQLGQALRQDTDKILVENKQFAEQKEALLRIVQDLHQTCVVAGLDLTGRKSIDDITMNFGLH